MKKKITPLTCKHITEILDDYDVFLFDLWGVIIETGQAYAPVIENIKTMMEAGRHVFFVTNAPRTKAFLQESLQAWDIPATAEMIMSSGEVALHMFNNSADTLDIPEPLVYHLGRKTNNLIEDYPIATTHNVHEANLILLTLFCEETEKEILEEAEYILTIISQKNITTLCANPDIGLMQNNNIYRYCAGYFAEKIKQLGGKVIYTGKPYPKIYEKIFNQLPSVTRNRILMIGDTFYTDIVGANRIGIHSALVLTGNARAYYHPFDPLDQQLMQVTIAAMEQKALPNFCIQLG